MTTMEQSAYRLAIALITRKEARVWPHGTDHSSAAETIRPPDPKANHAHVRTGNDNHMHHVDSADKVYFDQIARALEGAGRLLLVGHGTGKSSEVDRFRGFLRDKKPHLARHVVGTMHVNLEAMTEPEVLAMARDWFVKQVKSGQISD